MHPGLLDSIPLTKTINEEHLKDEWTQWHLAVWTWSIEVDGDDISVGVTIHLALWEELDATFFIARIEGWAHRGPDPRRSRSETRRRPRWKLPLQQG